MMIDRMTHGRAFVLTLGLALMLTACGGGEPDTAEVAVPETTEEEFEQAMEEAIDLIESVDGLVEGNDELEEVLDTTLELLETTPEPAAEIPALPTPLVEDGRTLRYSSLNITLDSWQLIADTTSDGTSCQAESGDLALALNLTIENSVPEPYTIEMGAMQLVDEAGEPVNFFTESRFNSANFGRFPSIAIGGLETINDTICTGLSAEDDPLTVTWVLGESGDRQHVQVPLNSEMPIVSGTYTPIEVSETFRFKGADFTLTGAAVTTGVWGQFLDEGQAPLESKWVLIYASVYNAENSALFIEDDEVRLGYGDQRISPTYPYYDLYRLAPYGMAIDTTSEGGILFEVPEDVAEVTLYMTTDRDGFSDRIEITIALPAG